MIYDVYCCFLVDHKFSRLTASKCSFAFLRLLHEMKRREGLQSTPGLVYIYIQEVPPKFVIYVLGSLQHLKKGLNQSQIKKISKLDRQ